LYLYSDFTLALIVKRNCACTRRSGADCAGPSEISWKAVVSVAEPCTLKADIKISNAVKCIWYSIVVTSCQTLSSNILKVYMSNQMSTYCKSAQLFNMS
jgi:hypothetical protein